MAVPIAISILRSKRVEWHIRFHILNHPIDCLQGCFRVAFVEHPCQEVLHAVFQVKHTVLKQVRSKQFAIKFRLTNSFTKIDLRQVSGYF